MTDRKINLLFIIPSLQIGGAERQMVDLVNRISRDRFNVHLFTFEKKLDLLEAVQKEQTCFHHHPRQHKWDLAPIKKIAEVIEKENIDIVHCTLEIGILFGLLAKLISRRKVKSVGAIHTTINRDLKNEVFDRILYAPLMSFCDAVITVCQNQRLHWGQKYPFLARKLVTVHNGVDGEKFQDLFSEEDKTRVKEVLGVHKGEFVIAIVSALARKKGHEYAFQAVKALTRAGDKVKLLIVGGGEKRRFLQDYAKKLSVARDLIWLGYQNDPRPFLAVSEVLLVPSIAESFPMAILEALAMRKPVIASRVGGIPEVVRDGHNGFLFEPRDVPSLVKILRRLISDEALRAELSRNARDSVTGEFSVGEMVRKTEAILSRVLGER